ncbi:MAG: sensor histidine kinase, partial [Longimicrobiales bacterium]
RMEDGSMAYGERWAQPAAGAYTGSYYGTAPLQPGDGYGGLELRVTLLPEVAERLVEGGLPQSRFPLALGLLTLNGLLMLVAVRQLRKSHELVRVRARFVRNVSHELRTPLQQMLLFTDLLRSDRIEDGTERAEALDILDAETRRLIELVRNVLSFSGRPEEGLQLVEVDLAGVVGETVEAFRPLAAARQARIEVVFRGRPRVLANTDSLKGVILNLFDNEVKYGPVGQQILVQVDQVDGTGPEAVGQVSVSDQGPGVPLEERDRVWDAFKRLDREEEGATAGSGIGLSIVRRLVGAMGGDVRVEEGPTEGATFTVRLPAEGGGR